MLSPSKPHIHVDAIVDCENAGDEVIIIDSITHEWLGEGGILDTVGEMGGSFQVAWKEMTPRHEKFKTAILESKCHVICTVRKDEAYILVDDINRAGKSIQKPVKAGLKDQTRKGWEYELTINLEIDQNHYAVSTKDRSRLFDGKAPFVITAETGALIKKWCEGSVKVPIVKEDVDALIAEFKKCTTVQELKAVKEAAAKHLVTVPEIQAIGKEMFDKITAPPPPAGEVVPPAETEQPETKVETPEETGSTPASEAAPPAGASEEMV